MHLIGAIFGLCSSLESREKSLSRFCRHNQRKQKSRKNQRVCFPLAMVSAYCGFRKQLTKYTVRPLIVVN